MGRGDKGRRTRADLILAAREVFAEKGYFDTRLADITARAGCATGTLYTYFRNREEVLGAILEAATSEQLHGSEVSLPEEPGPDDLVARIREGNRSYVEVYARNADLMYLMSQVAHIDPQIQRTRLDRASRFTERNARSIRRWQELGRVDPALDPRVAARALSSMVSRVCYHVFVDQPDPVYETAEGRAKLVDELTRLWSNALRLD